SSSSPVRRARSPDSRQSSRCRLSDAAPRPLRRGRSLLQERGFAPPRGASLAYCAARGRVIVAPDQATAGGWRPVARGGDDDMRFGCDSRFGKLVLCSSASAIALALAAIPGSAQVQKIGAPPEAKNMRLASHNDLQARSSYQPLIVHQGDRY